MSNRVTKCFTHTVLLFEPNLQQMSDATGPLLVYHATAPTFKRKDYILGIFLLLLCSLFIELHAVVSNQLRGGLHYGP
jgi:hypothetical protein